MSTRSGGNRGNVAARVREGGSRRYTGTASANRRSRSRTATAAAAGAAVTPPTTTAATATAPTRRARTEAEREHILARLEVRNAEREVRRQAAAGQIATRTDAADAAMDQARSAAREQLTREAIEAARTRAPVSYARYSALREEQARHAAEEERALNALGPHYARGEALYRHLTGERGLTAHQAARTPEYHAFRAEQQVAMKRYTEAAWARFKATQKADTIEKRLIGTRVSDERVNAHPTVRAAQARIDDIRANQDRIRASYQAAVRRNDEAQARLSQAAGALDLERGGPGVFFDFRSGRGTGQSGRETLRTIFGRDLSSHELSALTGASIGARVRVEPETEHSARIEVSNGRASRDFTISRDGNDIRLSEGETRNLGAKTAASGRDIIRSMVGMRSLGVTSIHATAARGGSYNGYYTWARLGFTGAIPPNVRADAQAKFGRGVTRVEQIMTKPGGPAWWKQHGDAWDATFNFRGRHSAATLRMLERAVRSERG